MSKLEEEPSIQFTVDKLSFSRILQLILDSEVQVQISINSNGEHLYHYSRFTNSKSDALGCAPMPFERFFNLENQDWKILKNEIDKKTTDKEARKELPAIMEKLEKLRKDIEKIKAAIKNKTKEVIENMTKGSEFFSFS